MTNEAKTGLSGLAQCLVVSGLLDVSQAESAYRAALDEGKPFISYVVQKKVLLARDIAFIAAQDFGIPLIDISAFDVDLVPHEFVSENLVRKHRALPIYQRGGRLYIILSDPTNLSALSDFKFHTGINTHAILAEEDKLDKVINDVLEARETTPLDELDDTDLDLIDVSMDVEEVEKDVGKDGVEDAPIVRFVHKIILDAINKSVSDIHFEPYEKKYRIRYRRDGILYEAASPPIKLAARITARLKVMSRLDVSERRTPQDGHFKILLSKTRGIDFRISTLPTTFGEKVVLRVLDPANATIGIDALGFHPAQKAMFINTIRRPQGMVLVTGPTGSGKTVTLYTALNMMKSVETNISTVEDPVEINVSGINQVAINNKVGLAFANTLRAFLRQDPDIIMVGEIRDLETIEIAIQAAQTGHMVLSTLHTNSAPETLIRMCSMGVPVYNVASTVNLVIAQRLARLLCKACKVVREIPEKIFKDEGIDLSQYDDITIYGPNEKGCDYCKGGFSGRIGLFEVMKVTPEIQKAIMDGGSAQDLLKIAVEQGMLSLRESGLQRVLEGIACIEEIHRVTVD